MSYDINKCAKTLELDKVLNMLSGEASLADAKQELKALTPSTDIGNVNNMLSETEAAFLLIARYSAPAMSNTPDVSGALARADVGAVLSISELIDVAKVLRVIRTVKAWRNNCDQKTATKIDYYFSALTPNNYLEDKINSAIKSPEEIYDKASDELYNIRRQISAKSSKIKDILDKIVKGPLSKYLQDNIVTQRDGRYVVPVRLEYRADVKGIVHDTSSSGQTLFIEPMSVVEANNDIRVLQNREEEEINRILSELSATVSEFSDNIRKSYMSLCAIDMVFAKAKLAYKMNAVVPKVNTDGIIKLNKARHPLIDKNKVVSVDINLGEEFSTLVITGPNTGGKTVTLKTVGIMCLMTMCGLMIPVAENSEIAVFNRIFADIGDEQSIELSLSTFSSHMVNIISILDNCNDNSLVLLDELCAGTDPVEGAALAKAILINLYNAGVKTVVTTHYPELKIYALDTNYVQNASCEFNINTLKPTYRLITGMPGRSNAFAISERLGLSKDIIHLANMQVTEEDKRFERVVGNLETARQSAEKREKQAAELERKAQLSIEKSDEILAKAHEEKLKILEETKQKAALIIENARYKSGEILNELEILRKSFNASNAENNLSKAKSLYKNTISQLLDESDVVTDRYTGEKITKEPQSGDKVVIASLGSDAIIISVDKEKSKALVMAGAIKTWVDYNDLRIVKNKPQKQDKKHKTVSGLQSVAERNVKGEIDLRGLAGDEAIMELEKYIDEAVLTGINVITIIHGKGTGALRKAVTTHLKGDKRIKFYRLGVFGEGENGVTIAQLK